MLSFTGQQRYFIYGSATDMRKGFNGLSGLVRSHFSSTLLSGDVFIFINKRRDRIKLLQWDHSGFVIYYKQLEKGTFEQPQMKAGATMELSRAQLVMLLDGIEIKQLKRRKRYRKTG